MLPTPRPLARPPALSTCPPGLCKVGLVSPDHAWGRRSQIAQPGNLLLGRCARAQRPAGNQGRAGPPPPRGPHLSWGQLERQGFGAPRRAAVTGETRRRQDERCCCCRCCRCCCCRLRRRSRALSGPEAAAAAAIAAAATALYASAYLRDHLAAPGHPTRDHGPKPSGPVDAQTHPNAAGTALSLALR
jgi:hypothetical protein